MTSKRCLFGYFQITKLLISEEIPMSTLANHIERFTWIHQQNMMTEEFVEETKMSIHWNLGRNYDSGLILDFKRKACVEYKMKKYQILV